MGRFWSIIDNWISGFLLQLFMWFFNYVSTNGDSSDTENWSWKNHILMKRKPALRLSQINIISQTKFKSTKENNVHRRGPPAPSAAVYPPSGPACVDSEELRLTKWKNSVISDQSNSLYRPRPRSPPLAASKLIDSSGGASLPTPQHLVLTSFTYALPPSPMPYL